VVEENCADSGKFFVKASHGQDYGMWGNFKVATWATTWLTWIRGLYGATRTSDPDSPASVRRRITADGFAAQPERWRAMSIPRDRWIDLLPASPGHPDGLQSVRIEVRDKASNIVTGVVNLRPNVDYDIDYIQGRLLLPSRLGGR